MTRSTTDTFFAIGFAFAAILLTAIVGIMLTIIDLHLFAEAPDMMQTIHAAGPMMLFRVTAGGIDYGVYEGEDEEDALDSFLADAGYENREDLPDHIDLAAFEIEEVSTFNKKAESALNEKFGQGRKSFSHSRDVEFEIDGPGSIPGEPERPGAYAVQLLPEGELENGELGFFGHTVEIDSETFQVNWLW